MDLFNWIFFGPSQLIASWPYAGFAIAFVLIGIQLGRTLIANEPISKQWFRHAAVFAGLLWIIFNLYEMQMAAVLPTAINASPIVRLDLIVLTPLLYVLTAFAVYSLLKPQIHQTPPLRDDSGRE